MGEMSRNAGIELEELRTVSPRKQAYHCQQAHGGITGLISGFSDMKELFQKIADYYDFPVEEILFCTRNTHRLIDSELYFDDFIFVHRKGVRKEVELTKVEGVLGLTLTDNGNGYTFIKGIQKRSLVDQSKQIQIGDHIEKINDKSLVGLGHAEVVNYIKSIPTGNKLVMHLVEPLKTVSRTLNSYTNNRLYIHDNNHFLNPFTANKLYEITLGKKNPNELAAAVDSCELEYFGFTDDFLIELWGIVSDAKEGDLLLLVQDRTMQIE
ncbi:PDZ domain-containing protein GIPC1 [Orchesella cincta]|uniref:PDZ domain-containing protein GIPC1 n=1 Tax=Orchesella cincta TaxID=48709 RepID=A0A1D2M2G5_ORCCI|nr:PDZ domain-containing protein GIPC1 [Orchesella cincta]